MDSEHYISSESIINRVSQHFTSSDMNISILSNPSINGFTGDSPKKSIESLPKIPKINNTSSTRIEKKSIIQSDDSDSDDMPLSHKFKKKIRNQNSVDNQHSKKSTEKLINTEYTSIKSEINLKSIGQNTPLNNLHKPEHIEPIKDFSLVNQKINVCMEHKDNLVDKVQDSNKLLKNQIIHNVKDKPHLLEDKIAAIQIRKEQHAKHKEQLKREIKKHVSISPNKFKLKEEFDDGEDDKPLIKKLKLSLFPEKIKDLKSNKHISSRDTIKQNTHHGKRIKKEEGEGAPHIWKWWEEEHREDGVKWNTLEHKGPIFAPDYEPLPANVIFKYDNKVLKLSKEAEEVAGFYARMLDHEYVTKSIFNENFLKDWRRVMNKEERQLIVDLKKCYFTSISEYYKIKSEERKNMTKEEKLKLKKQNEALQNEYGFCILDGRPQKIGNYKIEPPGLFRGRGDHPKMGRLKRRIQPEDVIINCGKYGKIPEPPAGHKWKEIKHDNTVTWLASWTENIQQSIKYVMLNPSSKLKGEKDWMKYETARRLKTSVDKIRAQYKEDWKSKSMMERQRGVALYFIDKLALRAGNEKDEETADTVGCCSLRVEHVIPHEILGDEEFVIEFDFLGKDCIRYQNTVPVEKRVFRNIELFMKNKKKDNELFDRLTTQILNKYLNEQMEGLTAKVFRTYNASLTLQDQLNKLTQSKVTSPEKLLAYNRANRAVAILCNHQRSIPKTHGKQMENLQEKLKAKKSAISEAKSEAKDAKAVYNKCHDDKSKVTYEKKKQKYERLKEQLLKLELQATDKEENKTIALGTSKLNYLDPRITVAWCKKHDINIAKLYNKTQRDKFLWAIEMATADFVF